MDLEGLDPTSRSFAAEFLRHNPRLARYARTEPRPGGGDFLVMTIPADDGGSPLVVDTGERGRVLVQWGRWSQEFDAPAGAGRSTELADALSLVEDLLSGAARTYVAWENDRWRGAGVLYDELDERRLLERQPRGRRIEIRSFTGESQTITVGGVDAG